MSVELKPCPFCGGTDIQPWPDDVMACMDCDTAGPVDNFGVGPAALWNHRVETPGCAQHSPSLAKAATLLKDCRRLLPGSTLGDKLRSRIGAQLREWGAL